MTLSMLITGMLGVTLLLKTAPTTAEPTAQQTVVSSFSPVVVVPLPTGSLSSQIIADSPDRMAIRRPPAPATATPRTSPTPRRTAKPTQRATARYRAVSRPSFSVSGIASWYCSQSIPICHYRYPPGSMVAAACGKLRAAMGPRWQGRIVTVTNRHGVSVVVKLVDWCGSTTKLIDLYYAPMSLLGGTGILSVTVRW